MSDETTAVAKNFVNLPIETLISAPIMAAAESNILLANATYDFIKNVWLKEGSANDSGPAAARTLQFTMDQPQEDGTVKPRTINAPLAALVETPNLMIRTIDVSFLLEVKDVATYKTDVTAKTDLTLSAQAGWWSAKLTGSLSGSSSQSRSTDRSAKYEIRVHAEQAEPTEGMSRLAQIFAGAVATRSA